MQANPSFRLVYVPGVTPGKWVRVWEQRLPDVPLTLVAVPVQEGQSTLLDGGADAGLVRLPVDRDSLSAIPLYAETTVVVFPKDHWLAAAEEVPVADLVDEVVFHPMDDCLDWQALPGRPAIERPATTADAIELVAANVGVLLVPQSLARLHHRRDLAYRPVPDAPQSQVVLSWPEDRTSELVEEFIGIVRGRTVNSSRGRAQAAPEAGAKQQQAGGKGAGKPGAGKAGGKSTGGGRPVARRSRAAAAPASRGAARRPAAGRAGPSPVPAVGGPGADGRRPGDAPVRLRRCGPGLPTGSPGPQACPAVGAGVGAGVGLRGVHRLRRSWVVLLAVDTPGGIKEVRPTDTPRGYQEIATIAHGAAHHRRNPCPAAPPTPPTPPVLPPPPLLPPS